jgi:polypeptide N-acetylgalactosaminyltransferase
VYHNEGNSTLLRGLTSIINNTPLQYLKEIILVDDASEDREYLHEPLDKFVKKLPVPVKIFRNQNRSGLIRSRLVGAQEASGDTLTFLDAHIEATHGWLVPLLNEIKNNKFDMSFIQTLLTPIIDYLYFL